MDAFAFLFIIVAITIPMIIIRLLVHRIKNGKNLKAMENNSDPQIRRRKAIIKSVVIIVALGLFSWFAAARIIEVVEIKNFEARLQAKKDAFALHREEYKKIFDTADAAFRASGKKVINVPYGELAPALPQTASGAMRKCFVMERLHWVAMPSEDQNDKAHRFGYSSYNDRKIDLHSEVDVPFRATQPDEVEILVFIDHRYTSTGWLPGTDVAVYQGYATISFVDKDTESVIMRILAEGPEPANYVYEGAQGPQWHDADVDQVITDVFREYLS